MFVKKYGFLTTRSTKINYGRYKASADKECLLAG